MMRRLGSVIVMVIGGWLTACSSLPEPPPLVRDFQRSEQMAVDAFVRGNLRQAQIDFSRAYTSANRLDDRRAMARTQLNLGMIAQYQGRIKDAHAAYQAAQRLSVSLDDHTLGLRAGVGMAELKLLDNEAMGGEALFSGLLNSMSNIDDPTLRIRILNGRAMAYLNANNPDAAAVDIERAMSLSRDQGHAHLRSATLSNSARLLRYQGDLDQALVMAHDALVLDRRLADPLAIADDLFLLANLYEAQGDLTQARQHLKRVEQLFGLNGQTSKLAAARAALARLPPHPSE